jgi:hypothetical protein
LVGIKQKIFKNKEKEKKEKRKKGKYSLINSSQNEKNESVCDLSLKQIPN